MLEPSITHTFIACIVYATPLGYIYGAGAYVAYMTLQRVHIVYMTVIDIVYHLYNDPSIALYPGPPNQPTPVKAKSVTRLIFFWWNGLILYTTIYAYIYIENQYKLFRYLFGKYWLWFKISQLH